MCSEGKDGKCPWSLSRTCAELWSLFLPLWLLGRRKAVYCDYVLSSGLQRQQHNSPVFPPVLSVALMPQPCFIVSMGCPVWRRCWVPVTRTSMQRRWRRCLGLWRGTEVSCLSPRARVCWGFVVVTWCCLVPRLHARQGPCALVHWGQSRG